MSNDKDSTCPRRTSSTETKLFRDMIRNPSWIDGSGVSEDAIPPEKKLNKTITQDHSANTWKYWEKAYLITCTGEGRWRNQREKSKKRIQYSVSKTITFLEKLCILFEKNPSIRWHETYCQIFRHCFGTAQLNKGIISLVHNAELTSAFRIKCLKKIKNWLIWGMMSLC